MSDDSKKANPISSLGNVGQGLIIKTGKDGIEIKVEKEDYDALGRAVDEVKSWFGVKKK